MKQFFKGLSNHPLYDKVYDWSKLLAVTGFAQVLIQGISFLSGILIIRMLPPEEYALYTLANVMLGTMIVLADGGISAGVMSQGGKVWQNKEKLGRVISTGLNLRKKFGIASIIVAAPILIYLLKHHGASWLMCILITLSLFPVFAATLTSQIYDIVPRLHQDVGKFQRIQIEVNVGRLALITATVFIFPWTFIILFLGGIAQWWGNFKLLKIAKKNADLDQEVDEQVESEIISFVKRMMPGAIYYCIAGQLTVWIASVIGSTSDVAEIGVLGRLGMIMGIFGQLFAILVIPRFARMPEKFKLLLTRFLQIQFLLICLSFFLVGLGWLFSEEILWVFGDDYADLNYEVVLVLIGSCLGLIAGQSFSLYVGRGWVIYPAVSISIEVVSVIAGFLLIDVSSIKGILLLNIFIAAGQAVMHMSFSLIKIFQTRSHQVI